MQEIKLSKRLKALADMVTTGNVVADVGCDHGFLSIYLICKCISPRVIASDVRKGPLAAAKDHVEERNLSEYIELRLSDGLMGYVPGEAQTLVCAGMGGRLMQRILMQSPEVTGSFKELILQPQSELMEFRIFLREHNFRIMDEDILCEDGKYYFVFRVKPSGEEKTDCDEESVPRRLGDKYGTKLLIRRHPVLRDYLNKCLVNCEVVRREMLAHRNEGSINERLERSLRENETEIEDLREALDFFGI